MSILSNLIRDFESISFIGMCKNAGKEKGVSVIANHMNYGLFKVDADLDCPKDAFRICRLLGLTDEIMDRIEKM